MKGGFSRMSSRFCSRCRVGWILLGLLPAGQMRADNVYVFQHDNVLGTSLEIQIRAATQPAARAAESRVLNEIDRLAKILSGYDTTSELSRWMATPGESLPVSPELLEVLAQCDRWRVASHGAFHPGVESLCRLWRQCAAQDRVPTATEIDAARVPAQSEPWVLDRTARRACLKSHMPLTLDALAKGYVVDRAVEAGFRPDAKATGLLVNIGGDLRVAGDMDSTVGIADPQRDSETTTPISRVRLRARSIATSGNYQRGNTIGSRTYSHIIDPRTGQPVDHVISASVTSARAADADALATICSVLPVAESLALIESLPDAACFLVCRDGTVVQSRSWDRLGLPPIHLTAYAADSRDQEEQEEAVIREPASKAKPDAKAAAGLWRAEHEVEVSFEIANPNSSQRYCRPYVAVWIEDQDGFPVRTLLLWVWTSGPGPRWIPDLRRWYRSDQLRQMVDDANLVNTISRATRPPGKYRVIWDGKDDQGKLVHTGKYTLFVEAAREHGTYQVISKTLTIDEKPFTEELPGNVEIKSAAVQYRVKRAADAGKK
jgi:FAD:protein FMN transferase